MYRFLAALSIFCLFCFFLTKIPIKRLSCEFLSLSLILANFSYKFVNYDMYERQELKIKIHALTEKYVFLFQCLKLYNNFSSLQVCSSPNKMLREQLI